MKYFVLTLCLLSQVCEATDWLSQTASSKLAYSVNFEQSPVVGLFKQFSVVYKTATDKSPQQLDVTVDIASADMGNSDINEAIRESDWFDVSQHARAIFTSNLVEKHQGGSFTATGELKLKGVTQTVRVPFTWRPSVSEPGVMVMTGQLKLNRLDFLIGTGDWASGDEIGLIVTVDFAVTLVASNP